MFVLNLHYTVVFPRLLVPTRITNLTRITEKMPTTKNSVILVVDCIKIRENGSSNKKLDFSVNCEKCCEKSNYQTNAWYISSHT